MKAKGLFGTTLIMATIVGGVFAANATAAAAQADSKAAPAKKAESAAKKTGAAKTVEITADDTMKYSVTAITATPGEAVHIKLTNKGTMPKMAAAHNFVLLKKGTDVSAFTTAAVMAGQTDYIPPKFTEQVLASTKLAGPGETVETDFKAPTVPGTYDFLCSFPGHFATMKGTLTVAK
jgi:azurin